MFVDFYKFPVSAQIVSPVDGHVYCADKAFGWAHGRPAIYNDDSIYEKYITELEGDSHNSEFIKKVYDIVGEVDLLFIDGDHSYDGVKQDFYNYSPLVKKDGYVVFHDIVSSDYHRSQGVNVDIFWNEIKNNYLSYEFCKPNDNPRLRPDCMGIGLLKMEKKMEKKMVKEEGKLVGTIEKLHSMIIEKETIKHTKIYDCFMFFNEFDLLEIRLNELKDVVDKFVIVDCNCTHTGRPKDYWLEPLLDTRFSEFRNKIEYIKMDASQTPLCDKSNWYAPNTAWGIEATQRNYSMRYLSEVCNDDDIIIAGDADEIPNIEAVKSYKKENGLCSLVEKMFYFYFNSGNNEKWGHQKIGTWRDFKKNSFSRIRNIPYYHTCCLSNGGWHFSYCGGVDKIIKKIESFAHAEFNTNAVKDRDRIKEVMKSGKDIYNREDLLPCVLVEIDETFPKYLRDNIEKFDKLGYIKHLDGPDNYSKNERLSDCKNYQISLTNEEKITLINLDEKIRTLLYDLGKLDIQFDTYKSKLLLQIADKKSIFDGIILEKVKTVPYKSDNYLKTEEDGFASKTTALPHIKSNKFKFLFKYPTRSRPGLFKRCIESWYSLLSKECNFQFILTIDKDDETMNNDEIKQYINQFDNLICYIGNSKTKIEAINANIPEDDWDIIVLISDDMIPQIKDYDIEIEQAFKEHFPNLDGLIYFFDGERIDICTLTIMGKKLYDYFGYIYHPSYKSLCSDNEQTDVCQTLGKYKFIKKCIIKHEFTQNTKKGLWTSMDELYRRNYIYFDCDLHNYNMRKKMGFSC